MNEETVKKDRKKEWSEPKFLLLSFNQTEGGTLPNQAEDLATTTFGGSI